MGKQLLVEERAPGRRVIEEFRVRFSGFALGMQWHPEKKKQKKMGQFERIHSSALFAAFGERRPVGGAHRFKVNYASTIQHLERTWHCGSRSHLPGDMAASRAGKLRPAEKLARKRACACRGDFLQTVTANYPPPPLPPGRRRDVKPVGYRTFVLRADPRPSVSCPWARRPNRHR